MLQLAYKAIIHNLDVKGYYLDKKTLFIADSDFTVQNKIAENTLGVSIPTVHKKEALNFIVCKTKTSSEWSFYLYNNDKSVAVKKVKEFMTTFNIADAVNEEDISVISVCHFGGGNVNVSRT